MIVENKLSFGSVVVLDNMSVSSVTVSLIDGRTLSTNKMRVLVPGQLGELTLLSFLPYTQLNITANVLSTETSSDTTSTEQFTLNNLTVEPTVTVDENGIATVFIGGTLSTSGNGNNHYTNTNYHAIYNIIISY